MNRTIYFFLSSTLKAQLLVLSTFLIFGNAKSQNINYSGIFPTLDHSGQLTDNWSYNSYNFAAINLNTSNNDRARFFYVYTENGLHYQLKNWTFSNLYVYERQEVFANYARNEHRLFQQITYKKPVKDAWELKFRLRFDERFIQNVISREFNFSHRLRFLLGTKYNVNDSWYAFAYTEAFLNTSNKFQYNENWSALQLGYNFNERNSLELGYLYVGWIYNAQNNWLHQNYLQLTWVNKVNFNKNKKLEN